MFIEPEQDKILKRSPTPSVRCLTTGMAAAATLTTMVEGECIRLPVRRLAYL